MPQVSEIFLVVLYLSKLPEFSIAFYSHQCWNFSQHIAAVYICLHQLCNVSRFFHVLLKLNPSSPIYHCQFSTLLCNLNSKNLTLLKQSLFLFFWLQYFSSPLHGTFYWFWKEKSVGGQLHMLVQGWMKVNSSTEFFFMNFHSWNSYWFLFFLKKALITLSNFFCCSFLLPLMSWQPHHIDVF